MAGITEEMKDRQTIILNLDNQPFGSFEVAAGLRDLLTIESAVRQHPFPYHYRVEWADAENESAGFVVTRKRSGAKDGHETDKPAEKMPANRQLSRPAKVYHPAVRGDMLYFPLILVCAVSSIYAADLWRFILSQTNLNSLPDWVDAHLLVDATRIAASVGLIGVVSRILLHYYGTALIVDGRGLSLRRGILTQHITQIRFNEIRRIDMRQGVWERIVNMGILEFSSSGTDGVDIRFDNIANPAGVKACIEALIARNPA